MDEKRYELGMIGLGVMGRNLVLNIADHGYAVVGYDKDPKGVQALREEAGDRDILGAESMDRFMAALRRPRAVMLLVPAGPPVDSVIRQLLPHLEAGDLIIDGGNSFFEDTNLRHDALAEVRVEYLGVGVSGGSSGARHGPSMMPGGPRSAYERVREMLEAAAAEVDGEPCVTYLGPRSAGHYVKMVHNGIEYGLMQLISETYDLMKRGPGLDDDELHAVYAHWNEEELGGYLMEITADIFSHVDPQTGKRLVDVILDRAKQKGTGKWTSQDAMNLGLPLPTIDAAVGMRAMSAGKDEREAASRALEGPDPSFRGEREAFIEELRRALYAAVILTYAQGMAQLHRASGEYDYGLNLEDVARIWRGGCIIRAALLEDIRAAFRTRPDLPNLLMDGSLGGRVMERQEELRRVVRSGTELGVPVPGLMASLAYFDAYRSAWLPANLIQAQRDYFGSHTYERIDAKGVFHTQWSKD